MSETGLLIFNRVYGLGANLIYAALFTAFFRPFIPSDSRKWRRLLLVFFVCILFEIIGNLASLPQGPYGLILMVMLLAAAKWIDVERSLIFLLTILYFNTKNAGALIVTSLNFIETQLWIAPENDPGAIYLYSITLLILLLLSHAVLLAVMLYVLGRRLCRRHLPLDKRELCYLSLVPMAGIVFGQMISRLLFEMKDGELLHLYERHPAFLAIVPVLALLFYAGSYLTIAFQQSMAALREEQATLYAEYQQTQAIRSRIHEAEQFYTRIRQLKHEMRSHLTNIKGLARSGEYDSLEDYISRMDESMSDLELTLQTGNPVTDVIVNDTRRRCLELDIRFQSDFNFPEPGAYDAFDMGIILQNLLQNALEACEKVSDGERFIVLTGKRKGHFFLIEVKNTFMGEVVFRQDGLPATTKEDVPMHGLGLSNVRREAEKYMGELELTTQQREFSVTVLLQERSN